MEHARGFRIWACRDLSERRGINPAIVVSDVKRTARNLSLEASLPASATDLPLATFSLMKLTSKIESFTTIPARETNPKRLGFGS
jgi:hypothetical protein